jgi:flagellar basal-body rod protein FlgG
MKLQEKRLAVIANNLANNTTVGYKAIQVSFEAPQPVTAEPSSCGLVLSSMTSYIDPSKAAHVATSAPFDLAIEGRGFFVIETPAGRRYTRDGRFMLDREKKLVTSSGGRVTGNHGDIIIEGSDVTVAPDGLVQVNKQSVGRLKVIDFEDKSLLYPVGSGLFTYSGEDNGVVDATEYVVKQGYIETSNVDIMKEVISLVDTQRSFEAYDKAKQMASETSKRLVELIAK